MENGRSSKVVAIVALCVGVVGLSLGFAAFSNTLTISSSASVKPNADTFNVDFTSTTGSVVAGAVTAERSLIEPAEGATLPEGFTAAAASIDNTDAPKITGLNVAFTEPGQQAVYKFYARNAGELVAYLNSITFANVTGQNAPKICTAGTNTNQALVDSACTGITVSIKVGNEAVTTSSVAPIDNHSLAVGAEDEIIVTIAYAKNAARADGDFNVALGDITLVYDSVDTVSAG